MVTSEVVPGDLKDPGRDLGLAAETGKTAPNPEKDLLSCIESLFIIPGESPSQSPDRTPKTLVDLVEYHLSSVPWIARTGSPFLHREIS